MKRITLALIALGLAGSALAQEAVFQTKTLTPEAALKAAQAALESCRKQGFQAAIAVTDRNGLVQVLLRDRYAGPHTPDIAINKAWTAASFKTSTLEFGKDTQAGKPMSGIRNHPRVIAAGGGLPIEGGGTLVGAIGVSGGPGGEADESCAKAGIKAIADSLEL
jgi:uncharacterized protein GlcG (DUF336 family)